MLSRKTPEANLENKRGAWKAIGFVASLSLLLSALAWTSYDVAITRAIDFEADLLEDEEIPVNVVQPPPPPPPRRLCRRPCTRRCLPRARMPGGGASTSV